MISSRWAFAAVCFTSLSLGAGCGSSDAEDGASVTAEANEAKKFFVHDKLYYVHITGWDPNRMTPASLTEEQQTRGAKVTISSVKPDSGDHCPDAGATVLKETKEFSLRTSGNFTANTPKSSYKIKLLSDEARFLGMKALNLKSMWNDVSQMREALAWELFKKADIPAPRHAYARLCINDKYYGLYSVIENVDKPFLKERFESNDGNLYKANWPDADIGPADLLYRSKNGNDGGRNYFKQSDPDNRTYELDTNDDKAEFNTYDDLAAFIRVLNGKTIDTTDFNSSAYKDELESVFDTKAYLRWASVNILLGAWDNYYRTPSNYFLYNAGKNNDETFVSEPFFTWIPWDYDNTFGIDFFRVAWEKESIVDWEKFTSTDQKKLPLIANMLKNKQFLKYYLDHMDCVLDNFFNDKWVTREIGDEGSHKGLWQLVRKSAFLESDGPTNPPHTGRQFTNDQVFFNGFQQTQLEKDAMFAWGIVNFVKMRHDSAKAQIKDLRSRNHLSPPASPVCKVN